MSAVHPIRTVAKLVPAQEAISAVRRGSRVMIGGFGLVGTPLTLIEALLGSDEARELTTISNNVGEPGRGLGRVLLDGRISHAIGSFFTSNPDVIDRRERGLLDVTVVPQGTLAEAIRAAGAGLGGFYTRTGAGTLFAQGREERIIDGQRYLFQEAIHADVALIRAHRADDLGNLVYRLSARNFNPDMATAATMTIAEVDEVVPVGELSPEEIVTPHLFVNRIVLAEPPRV